VPGGAAQGALVAPQPCRSAAKARAWQGEPAGAVEPARTAPAIRPNAHPLGHTTLEAGEPSAAGDIAWGYVKAGGGSRAAVLLL